MLCGALDRDCHLGWAHRRGNPKESFGRIRIREFAVKFLIGEIKPQEAEKLMRDTGRDWWDESLGRAATVASEVIRLAEEMSVGGLEYWVRSWNTIKQGG